MERDRVKLKSVKYGITGGAIGNVVGRLKPSGPITADFGGRIVLLRGAEVEILERPGIDSVYIREED